MEEISSDLYMYAILFSKDVVHFTTMVETGCPGNDFAGVKSANSPVDCGAICLQLPGCIGFTFHTSSTGVYCYPKDVCNSFNLNIEVKTYLLRTGGYELIVLSFII